MKLRFIKTALILMACVTLGGCGAKNAEPEKTLYQRISETLTGLETYEATATVRYYSNKTSNAYQTKQQCRMSGEYRVEVLDPSEGAGNVTVFDGKTIRQFNPNVSGKIAVGTTETPERSEIFLTSFIRNHLAGQEVTIAVSSQEDSDRYTSLDAVIPGDNPYLATERLVVNNETLKPKELIVFDSEGNERICVTYQEVNYNVELADTLFTTDAGAGN